MFRCCTAATERESNMKPRCPFRSRSERRRIECRFARSTGFEVDVRLIDENQNKQHKMKIARILSLTALLSSTFILPLAVAADEPAAPGDIVVVASAAGSFKTL